MAEEFLTPKRNSYFHQVNQFFRLFLLFLPYTIFGQISIVPFVGSGSLNFADTVICNSNSTTLAISLTGSPTNVTWSLANHPTGATISPNAGDTNATVNWLPSQTIQNIQVKVEDASSTPSAVDYATLVIQPVAGSINLSTATYCRSYSPFNLPAGIPVG